MADSIKKWLLGGIIGARNWRGWDSSAAVAQLEKREEKRGKVWNPSLDIIHQSLKPSFWTSCIRQCRAVIRAPLFSPLSVKSCVLNRACCWGWQTTAGEKETEEGGREQKKKRETWRERKKQGRRGEWALQQWEQRSKTNPVEEPPLQSDEQRCLTPSSSISSSSCLHCRFFPLLLPASSHYSSVRWESPAHGSSCSSRSTEPAGSPPHIA